MVKIFKSLQGTTGRLTLNMRTRYVAASAVTETHTHTQTNKMTTVTPALAH